MPSTRPGTVAPCLTDAEIELLSLLAAGMPTSTIAHRLHLSERSVRRRARLVCDRLEVRSPIEAVVWAAKHGLI